MHKIETVATKVGEDGRSSDRNKRKTGFTPDMKQFPQSFQGKIILNLESHLLLILSFKYEGKIMIFWGMQELHEVHRPCILERERRLKIIL